MSDLHTPALIAEFASRAICVSGTARSGTTLIGSLVHSHARIEYAFEPSGLLSILHRRDSLPQETLKGLYAEYLFHEIYINQISGRTLNFNQNDWSYIFKVKSIEEIRSRFESSSRTADLFELSRNHTVAFKIPEILQGIPRIKLLYPSTRVIICIRPPYDVVNSVLLRQWYQGNPLDHRKAGPLRQINNLLIPASLHDIDAQSWLSLSEAERAYACFANTYAEENIPEDALIVDYERLLAAPEEVCRKITASFGLTVGPRTLDIISGIKAQSTAKQSLPSGGKWKELAEERYEKIRVKTL